MSNKKQTKKYRELKESIKTCIKESVENIDYEIIQIAGTIRGYMLLRQFYSNHSQNNVLDDFLHFVEGLEFKVTDNVLYVSHTLYDTFMEESYLLDGPNTKDNLANLTTLLNYISRLFVEKRQSCFSMMNITGLVSPYDEASFKELFSIEDYIESIMRFCIVLS